MKKFDRLLAFSRLISKDTTLISEVQLAENQPLNYLSQFSERLRERGIDSTVPELPWLALVDGLARRGQLVELDWKDNPEELIAAAMDLLKGHPDFEDLASKLTTTTPFIDEDIEEFLPQLNQKLLLFDVQLIWLDIDSDSYPITVLPTKTLEEAKRFAHESGYGNLKT